MSLWYDASKLILGRNSIMKLETREVEKERDCSIKSAEILKDCWNIDLGSLHLKIVLLIVLYSIISQFQSFIQKGNRNAYKNTT